MNIVLIRIDAQDASGGAVPVRLSSHDIPEACHLGGEEWEPALARLPDFALDFFGGAFSGQVISPRTSFSVATIGLVAFGAAPAARARFADARVRIWVGDITSAATVDLGPLTLRFDGRITGEPDIDDAGRTASFDAAVQDSWADKPLLPLFAGTGGIEGPADLTGQPKPLVLGNARFCGGVLIDNVDNVWMVSHGAVQAVNAVYDRLASLGTSAGNFADLAALKAAAIPNGSWGTCLAQGLVRLGAPPDGRVSLDVSGSNSGTGGYVRRPGAIIRRIADMAGGTVNAASLSTLDTARPYNLQLQLREQVTAREIIARIADSVGAVAGVSLRGELFAQALTLGASGPTLNGDDSSELRVAAVEELAKAAPSWRLATEAELTFEVHSAEEAAFSYRWQGEYAAARVYRRDDVVTGPDSAAWAYINTAPAAGQALPVWPTTFNSHWRLFQAPGSAGVAPANANRVPFSRFEGGRGWGTAGAFNPTPFLIVSDGRNFICAEPTFTAANQDVFLFSTPRFPVSGSERLSVSGRVQAFALPGGAAPSFWQYYIEYYDAAGVIISNTPISNGSAAISENILLANFSTAPSNARTAQVVLLYKSSAAGLVRLAILEPMVTSAAAGQTVHPPYTPGPNAVDGANPNTDISIDGIGRILGIGLGAGEFVNNRGVIPRGLLSARPASGDFLGQGYYATDTREIFQWDGFNWITSADLTATLSGTSEIIVDYNSADTLTSPLPLTENFQLSARGGAAFTSGVSWSVALVTGSFSGAAPSISGTGTGQLSINSGLASPEAQLRVTAAIGGAAYPPMSVKITKRVAPPTSSGGGGGGGSNFASDNTFSQFSTTTFTAISDDLSITLPAGVTTATLTASSLTLRTANTNLPLGDTICEYKWQRESSPGTWVDVGASATSSPNPGVVEDPDSGGFRLRQLGSVTCSRSATGLSAGSAQKFRLVARVSGGNTRGVTTSGTVSAQG